MKEIKDVQGPQLKKVMLEPVQISIEPISRMLLIKQGENEIRLTRDQVNNMTRLRNHEYESDVFTSTITPRNKFQLADNGNIIATCKNDYSDDTIVIQNTKRYDDLQRIINYVDRNKPRIAWARDFRRK